LRTGNDKIAPIVYRLCEFLVIALSKTKETLVYMVLEVLGLSMIRNHFRHIMAGLLALVFATSVFARGQSWDFLGYTHLDGGQDHGKIQITRRNGLFHTIQLRVSGDPIFFDRLIVHFGNGTSEEFVVSGWISPEEKNYVIDLHGEGRVLESVELKYYKEAWGHNPRVSLYGTRPQEGDGVSKN
jgi:hypothetical protein